MGKDTTTSGELVARTGCKRELQFVLKSQSEICGGDSLGLTRAGTRNLNVESTGMEGKMKRGLDYAKRRITTTMSDLPEDLLVGILSRVPITSLGSVRSTCKQWNFLSRNQIFGKLSETKNQFLGFMMKDLRICSVRMDLQGICDDFIDLSIKQVSVLNHIEIYRIYDCDGLLLCILTDTSRLLVWNPYLGQTRWIPHLFGSRDGFCLGYDNNGNHKILRILDFYSIRETFSGLKIYEFNSNSWRDLDVTPNCHILPWRNSGVTLKGNAYFYARKEIIVEGAATREYFLLGFDFTSERFGPCLSLPFRCDINDTVILSRVRDKQLAVLRQSWSGKIMDIWVTSKIDYNELLWTKWVEVDMNHYPKHILFGSFFIDEKNKVAVVFHVGSWNQCFEKNFYQGVHIIGQDGYFKPINVRGSLYQLKYRLTLIQLLCSSYVPSLVEI